MSRNDTHTPGTSAYSESAPGRAASPSYGTTLAIEDERYPVWQTFACHEIRIELPQRVWFACDPQVPLGSHTTTGAGPCDGIVAPLPLNAPATRPAATQPATAPSKKARQ